MKLPNPLTSLNHPFNFPIIIPHYYFRPKSSWKSQTYSSTFLLLRPLLLIHHRPWLLTLTHSRHTIRGKNVVWERRNNGRTPARALIFRRDARIDQSGQPSRDTIGRVSATLSLQDPAANKRTKDDEREKEREERMGGWVAAYEAVAHFHAVTSTLYPRIRHRIR